MGNLATMNRAKAADEIYNIAGYSQASGIHVKDNEPVGRYWYRGCSDVRFCIGSALAFELALMFDQIGEELEDAEICCIAESALSNSKVLELYEKAGGPEATVFDIRESSIINESPAVPDRFGIPRRSITYSGPMSYRMLTSYAKTEFLDCIQQVWSGGFIVSRSGTRLSRRLNGIQKSLNLANALMLGEHEMYLPQGRGTGPKLSGWRREAVSCSNFSNLTGLDDECQKIFDSISVFQDYTRIWTRVIEEYKYVAISIDEKDLVDDYEGVRKAFKAVGDFIQVDTYLDAYRAGVPAEDLLA